MPRKLKIPPGQAHKFATETDSDLQALLALSPDEASAWIDDNVRGHTETVNLLKLLVKQVVLLSNDR